MKTSALALQLIVFSASAAAFAQIPSLTLPEGVGVNIHFAAGHTRDLDLIAAAGFKFVRMDLIWQATERAPGQYDWTPYDELVSHLKPARPSRDVILDYSHSAYETNVSARRAVGEPVPESATASPRHPESIAAFARWSAAAATHFRGDNVIWEIFNEPNGFFWKPKPDAREYSALALAAARAIRQAEPNATIAAPALAAMDWDFLQIFLASGILETIDAVSVHPYREGSRPPETAAPDYAKLRQWIDHYTSPAKKGKIPILSGEWGYHTSSHGVSLETQAAYAARQQLFNLSKGVPLSIWYDWKNDGTNPNDGEQNFGTVTDALDPKPAYLALQTMTRELAGFHFTQRLDTPDTNDFILQFENANHAQKIAAWTLAPPHATPTPVGQLPLATLPIYRDLP